MILLVVDTQKAICMGVKKKSEAIEQYRCFVT